MAQITNSAFPCLIIIGLSLLLSTSGIFAESVRIGDINSSRRWVYLGGLTSEFDGSQEQANRKVLDEIGKNIGISFIAVKPQTRCEDAQSQLCWPYQTPDALFKTEAQIRNEFRGERISGFIGFSNGAFFLNELVQHKQLRVPVIAIAGAGKISKGPKRNRHYLVISEKDLHYNSAKQLVEDAKATPLKVAFISYNDGQHVIPKAELNRLLADI